MTERPILFSAPMVKAILAGSKTETRRVVTSANSLVNGSPPCMRKNKDIIEAWCNLDFSKAWVDKGPSPAGNPGPYLKVPGGDESVHRVYSRVQAGDRLWVKETFVPRYFDDGKPAYRADWTAWATEVVKQPKWKPSIFMPRWASRITLEVTDVRVERLQDISDEDAGAEGVSCWVCFEVLWQSINGKRPGCSWDDNPLVWVIAFRRVESAAVEKAS